MTERKPGAVPPAFEKHLPRIAILKGRRIAGQLPYQGRPGNPFFYHGGIAHPDAIIPDQDSQDSGANSPYLGNDPGGRGILEFTPAYPDPGFERDALPQATPGKPHHFDRPLLQKIRAKEIHHHYRMVII